MIVLDEHLHGRRTIEAISSWYRGQVMSVTSLRPHSVIKDEAIPALLHQAKQPTFVTINVADFWRRAPPHARYCIVTVDAPTERIGSVPELVRQLLRLPEFATKTRRMGRVIRVSSRQIEHYGLDRRIQTVLWSA